MYLDWESSDKDYYVIDIEGDSLDCTKIWCMCWENVKTKEKGQCVSYEQIRNFFKQTSGSCYVGHNLVKFDIPFLVKLVGVRVTRAQVIDTLILATLYSPSLAGGHSLGAWGERIGFPKTDFHDWSRLSSEMLAYCAQDVLITAELYRRLVKVLRKIGFSERACYIQHHITAIIDKQHQNGFYFDGPRALLFFQQLRKREEELKEQIYHAFPPRRVLVREGKTTIKSGSPSAQFLKDSERYIIFEDAGTYQAYEDVGFNLGSPKQRVERLSELGWEADEFTKTGLPKPNEKSLIKFAEESGIAEAALITKWMSINGRANMISNWLDYWNEDDHCIHGKLFVADTLRFRHQAPNTANIPAVRPKKGADGVDTVLLGEAGYYTYEARDLWCARPGRVLVGTDAAGLELRMLAHYLNRPAFTEAVINGRSEDGTDVHSVNAELAGCSRPVAKTLIYATMYGAQAGKVAQIIKGTRKEGAALRETFLERLGIKGVMDDAIAEQNSGRVWLVDGAGVVCPSPHAALNYKLQGGGARVMAQGAIFLDGHIRRSGLDSLKVGDIHDEWQYDVAPKDAREHARLSVQAIREAGEELNLTLPLDGTAKEGLTWAQTH